MRVSFDDVLGTNYTPTHDERRLLAALIESKVQELSFLNDIIAPLLVKRDKLNDDILAHKALLTPARRLLPELVSEVFAHSIHYLPPTRGQFNVENNSLLRFAMPSVHHAPLLLGRICRRWRDVALSTPSLWATISIPWGFTSIDGLQEWISRAGSCKLSFTIWAGRGNIELFKILASYQQRWYDVVLGLNDDEAEFGREFVESLSPEYQSLQTMEIGAWGSPANDNPLVLGSTPNLRQLIVRDESFKFITLDGSPTLCLREIDAMSTAPLRSTDLLALLRLSPAVEVVSAHVLNRFNGDEEQRDILNLPAVKHMNISGLYDGNPNFCLLGRLCLPALEEFSFYRRHPWSWGFERSNSPQIVSLIHRSCPPLKVLRVWGGHSIPSVDIMECLPFLPVLSTLHLEKLEGKLDELINALTGPIPPTNDNLSGCICPELSDIYFNSIDALPPESVINMILSRSPNRWSRLAHVTVLSCRESEVLADPRIIDCIENGLRFKGYVEIG